MKTRPSPKKIAPRTSASPSASSRSAPPDSPTTLPLSDEVRELATVLREFDLTEIEVERGGQRLRVRREILAAMAPAPIHTHTAATSAPTTAAPPSASGDTSAPAATSKSGAPVEHGHPAVYITSPFVGTFYRSPSPDAPPFVDLSQRVKKGQVLCIIEAMKLMNEIEAELDGVIVACLAENGQPVEYGEPLFQIRP